MHSILSKNYQPNKAHLADPINDVRCIPEFAFDCSEFNQSIKNALFSNPSMLTETGDILHDVASLSADELPFGVRKTLYDFRVNGNTNGVLLFRNLQLISKGDELTDECASLLISAFASRMGTMIGYSQEYEGEIIQNIIPKKELEYTQTSRGSKTLLEYHTEICFHPYRPRFVLLLCIRSDHERQAKTFFAPVKKLIDRIPEEYRSVLWQEKFVTGVDASFLNEDSEDNSGPTLSILDGNVHDPFIRWDLDLMHGTDKQSCEVLSLLQKAAAESLDSCVLLPGDLLLIDNYRSVHGRSGFTPRYDGKDRWLKRVCVVSDIDSSAASRSLGCNIIDSKSFT